MSPGLLLHDEKSWKSSICDELEKKTNSTWKELNCWFIFIVFVCFICFAIMLKNSFFLPTEQPYQENCQGARKIWGVSLSSSSQYCAALALVCPGGSDLFHTFNGNCLQINIKLTFILRLFLFITMGVVWSIRKVRGHWKDLLHITITQWVWVEMKCLHINC